MTTVSTFRGQPIEIQVDINKVCKRANYEIVNVSLTYNSDKGYYVAIVTFKDLKGGAE